MFSTTASKQSPDSKNSDTETYGIALLCCVAMVSFWWHKNALKLERFYVTHFESIYLALYGVVVLLLLFVAIMIKRKTKAMSERATKLAPLWTRSSDNIETGCTPDGIDLYLSNQARCAHVQVIGTTGSGKSHSVVVPWCVRDLRRGHSSIIIDGKGAKDLAQDVFEAIDFGGTECQRLHFDLGNLNCPLTINPLRYGSPQQITDRLFSSFEFEDPYYRSIQYDICGYLIQLLHKTGPVVTFTRLHELLTRDSVLADHVSLLTDGEALKVILKDFLREPMKDRRAKLSGLISQLAPFAVGEVAHLVNGADSPMYHALLDQAQVTCLILSLPTLKYQKLGHQLGKLLLQELAWCVGERDNLPAVSFSSVFLDEFYEFAYEEFISVLNKARSAQVGLHLCHQAISDLKRVSDSFATGVNTNTTIKCVLGLNDPETADFYARHFGTRTNVKLTEQVQAKGFFKSKEETGRGSSREVEEYKIHPNVLKGLYQGKGVLHLPTKHGTVTELVQFNPLHFKEFLIAES